MEPQQIKIEDVKLLSEDTISIPQPDLIVNFDVLEREIKMLDWQEEMFTRQIQDIQDKRAEKELLLTKREK